jgi:raffinose/stachyose/melibiose transport system permease protein
MSKKKKEKLLITIATLITVLQIIPLVIIILNSLRSNTEIDVQMLGIPSSLNFENYIVAWTKGGYLQAYGNSLLIGLCSALAILITAGLAVYGLTKMKCFFPRFFRNYFVASLAIPSFAVIVPLYFFFNKLNLVNNLFGMVLIYTATNMPFCFMFMYAFFSRSCEYNGNLITSSTRSLKDSTSRPSSADCISSMGRYSAYVIHLVLLIITFTPL